MPVNEKYRTLVFPFSLKKPDMKYLEEDTEEINSYLDKLANEIPELTKSWKGDWSLASHSLTVYEGHALLTIFLKRATT
jgi:hypothetical protein